MVQPLLVSISALTLATETVRSILKIDDVVRFQRDDSIIHLLDYWDGTLNFNIDHLCFLAGKCSISFVPAPKPAQTRPRDPGLCQLHIISTVDVRLHKLIKGLFLLTPAADCGLLLIIFGT